MKLNAVKNVLSLFGLTIATGATLLIGVLFERTQSAGAYHHVFYLLCYGFGSYTFVVYIYKTLKGVKPDIELLMFLAAIGAAFLGKWGEGGLLLFLFGMGNNLESYATRVANNSLSRLTKLMPKMALVKHGNETKEIPVEHLRIGDVIVVKPNSSINADGVVVGGHSSVNEATITGESIPVEKYSPLSILQTDSLYQIPPAYRVFAGTMNVQGFLEVRVIKEAKDSTISKLIQLVHEAREQKASVQKFTEKFEQIFVPLVLGLVFLLNFAFLVLDETFAQSFYRALTVLVVSSPCALVISAPSTVLSGVARAAKAGVLIKGGKPLEELGTVKGIAFDKTGTLTKADPRVTDFISCNGISDFELKKIVLAVESQSDHILGKAIVRDIKRDDEINDLPVVTNFSALTGRGVRASLDGEVIVIGNDKAFREMHEYELPKDTSEKIQQLEDEGKTSMVVSKAGKVIGIIAIMDVPRHESPTIVRKLREMGISKLVMLTGDNPKVAASISKQVGITEVEAGLMPVDKVSVIQKIIDQNIKIAMVGDGVNDAPALAMSTVGISMGAAGSDVAMESADVALMSDKLDNLPFAIGLGRKARRIIKENIFISLGVIAIMLPVTLLGLANIGFAVLIHEGSTVLVAFNAMRLLGFQVAKK
jgi:Cd2+/Zn2+-exporting ATPase